jgi:hypothetical protein
MKNKQITIDFYGINLIVEIEIYGNYISESLETPAEYPEIEIIYIFVEDSNINIYDIFSNKQLDIINDLINETYDWF